MSICFWKADAFCAKIHFTIALQPQGCSLFVLNFPPNFRFVFLYNCSYKKECIDSEKGNLHAVL